MIVVISDLHLTDGTTGRSISPGAFRIFRERLSDMAYDASKRADGSYRPIEGLDIIMLGDIIDHIRSTLWTDGESTVRPWDDPRDEQFIKRVNRITNAILSHNREAIEILKSLNGWVTIPPATDAGSVDRSVTRDPLDPRRVGVKVRLHYVIGNHDWFFALPGVDYDRMRAKVVDALGLENGSGPFPHRVWDEGSELHAVCESHDLYLQHGDIFDSFNYDESQPNRGHATLGDALVIELFNPFPRRVDEALRGKIPDPIIDGLYELGNISPALVAPVWINNLLERYHCPSDPAEKVKEIWDELAENLLSLDFLKSKDTLNPFETVDAVQAVLKFSQLARFKSISELTSWIYQRIWGGEISYAEHAAKDAKVRAWAEHLVYGHTHMPELVPIDVLDTKQGPVEQVYMNSGTWRLVHALAHNREPYEKFSSYYTMTYLGFYREDERRGRRFESWTGTLDY